MRIDPPQRSNLRTGHRPPVDVGQPSPSSDLDSPTPPGLAAAPTDILDRIEVIVVCYRSALLVHELLESWGDTLSVCVADNANNEDGLKGAVAAFNKARYLQLDGLGFSRAANCGIRSSSADIVVVANPDCRATVEDITRLAAGLAQDEAALCHGAIEEIAHNRFYGGGWEPSPMRCLVHALGLHHVFPTWGIQAITRAGAPAPEVDWLSGTVAAYWRERLLRLGGFDERFYVFSEDMALAHASARQGLRQVIRADVIVRPNPAGSGSPSLAMGSVQGASLAHYFQGYQGPVSGALSRTTLAAGFVGRAVIAYLQHDRELSRRQMRFVHGILSGRAKIAGREVSRSRAREIDAERRPLRHRVL